MEKHNQKDKDLEELSQLYLFQELFKFLRESPGIAISTAYLVLILSSMGYLYVLFVAFDINIVKYVTFEDILATPIKNPDILIAFVAVLFVLYTSDIGSRFRARQQIKYANQKMPLGNKILQMIFWGPKKRQSNIKVVVWVLIFCLTAYIILFANVEAERIKEGEGDHIEITLADEAKPIKSILLGTTVNYVFTYNPKTNESVIFSIESVQSLKKLAGSNPSSSP